MLERLESGYPMVALHCHELVEAGTRYLRLGGEKIAVQAAAVPRGPADVRTLPPYYAKLHSVSALPGIFLNITAAVWASTTDMSRGLWAVEVVEHGLSCALLPVAEAAVEAGIAAAQCVLPPDLAVFEPKVVDGTQLFAAVVFDTMLALIEK